MKLTRTAGVLAVAALGATSLALAAPANADLVTYCVGEGGAVTVPGDLVVPAGESCTLTGTTVEGNTTVESGADLVVTDASLNGSLDVADDAYFDSTTSSVSGAVEMSGAYGAFLDGSQVDRRIRSTKGEASVAGFVYSFDSQLGGALVTRRGEVYLETTELSGRLDSRNSTFTDSYESFIDGTVRVQNNSLGSVFCATVVQGSGDFLRNGDVVQLGSNGPFTQCEQPSYWGATLTASGNTGGVFVDNNIVNGDLVFDANDPVAQLGPNNNVRGDIVGDYEDWTPAAAMSRQSLAPDAPANRALKLQKKAAERRTAAKKAAHLAGPADLT